MEELYKLVESGDLLGIPRILGTNTYPDIDKMLKYYEDKEEYEKCAILVKAILPVESKEELEIENEFLEAIGCQL